MRHTLQAAILALTSLAILPAQAEEDIVVTATRTPTPAARLPARVEIIDRADIEANNFATLPEAIGAEAVQAGGVGQQTSLFLRGANSSHTLALFDGVRLNDRSNPTGQYDFGQDTLGGLDRIEVLRGPASAVYGSDALGGVVNLIPRRGAETAFEPFAEAAFGSFETRRALVGAAGAAGGFEYGISGEWFDTAGYDLVPTRMATHGGEPDGAAIATFTAAARREGARFALDLLVRHRASEAEYDTFSGGPFFDLRADDPDLGNTAAQTLWRIGAETEGPAGLRFRLSGGQVLSERSENDGGVALAQAQAVRSFADMTAHFNAGQAEVTAGIGLERDAIDTSSQFANPLAADETHFGAFLIAQADLGRRVVATAAARLDGFEDFDAAATYSLGAVAELAPFRLYVSHGTAFKAPSLSERFETGFFNVGNPNLRPEQANAWEIGADIDLGPALSLGGSYFQSRVQNLIEYDFFELKNINVGRARIDGAEAYLAAAPATWVSLRLSYAWTDARNSATDAPLARRPEHAWRFDAHIKSGNRLAVNLSWTYVGGRGDVTYDNAGAFASGTGRARPFNVGALAAHYQLNQAAELFARIDNITDQTFEQPAAFAGPPRRGLIGVRVSF